MERQEKRSCVIFHDVTERARCVYATDSVTELLGWSPQELMGMSLFTLVHAEEEQAARNLHFEILERDLSATLTYMRLQRKDGGYALCALSRSVAKNFVVGTLSLATDDPGNTRAALATGGVYVLTPTAGHLAFLRWATRVGPSQGVIYRGPPNGPPTPFSQLPERSDRLALLLDRFTQKSASLLYWSDDSFFPQGLAVKQDLLQFIENKSERSEFTGAMDVVRGWMTDVEGPNGGPFATCNFTLRTFPDPPQDRQVEGIFIATSDAILLTLVPLT